MKILEVRSSRAFGRRRTACALATLCVFALMHSVVAAQFNMPTVTSSKRNWRVQISGRVAANGLVLRNAAGAVVAPGTAGATTRYVEYTPAGQIVRVAAVNVVGSGGAVGQAPATSANVVVTSAIEYNTRVRAWNDALANYELSPGRVATQVLSAEAYGSAGIRCLGETGQPTSVSLRPSTRWVRVEVANSEQLRSCATLIVAQSNLADPSHYVPGTDSDPFSTPMSVLLDADGTIKLRSAVGNVFAFETAYFTPRAGGDTRCFVDGVAYQDMAEHGSMNANQFRRCRPGSQGFVWAPVSGALIDMFMPKGGLTYTNSVGMWGLTATGMSQSMDVQGGTIGSVQIPMYSDEYDYTTTAWIRFANFNPRSQSSRQFSLTGRVFVRDPHDAPAPPFLNFLVDVTEVRVIGSVHDEVGNVVPVVDGDAGGEAFTTYSYSAPSPGGPVAPTGLLRQISARDLMDTDLYVFRVANGKLLGERLGMGRSRELAGLENEAGIPVLPQYAGLAYLDFTALIRGPQTTSERAGQRSMVPGATVTAEDIEAAGGRLNNEVRYGIELDYVRPSTPSSHPVRAGERLDLVLINRATGYLGRARGVARMSPTGTLVIVKDGPAASPDSIAIQMHPPNLRVRATRTSEGANGADRRSVIGFEGAGLSSDKMIEITTEWLDPFGQALPPELPGMTGRLARIVEGALVRVGTGAAAQGLTGLFSIEPGYHAQVVHLPEASERARYYVHVDGAPLSRLTDFAGAGGLNPENMFSTHEVCYTRQLNGGRVSQCFSRPPDNGPLGERPATFVPVKTQIFDALATRAAYEANARALAEAHQPGQPVPVLGAIPPVYRFTYSPEFQFSLYDLDVEAVRVETGYTNVGGSRTDLNIDYDLGVGNDPLSGFTGNRDLLFGIGYAALVALAGDRQTVNTGAVAGFPSLEELLTLTPAHQAEILGELLNSLTPEDFLSLQVYQANDAGNVLLDLHGLPLVLATVEPFHLERRHQIQQFEGGIPSGPGFVDDHATFGFTVLRDARVKVRLERADGHALTTIAEATLPPGRHHFVFDAGRGLLGGVTAATPGVQIVLEATPVDPVTNGIEVTHRVVWPGTIAERHNNLTVGQTVVHGVMLQDGSLRLSRTDYQVDGLGPSHIWSRSYTNLGTAADASPLGPGWSHAYDLRAHGLTTDEMLSDSVPAWVRTQAGRFFDADAVPQTRPTWTGIAVNGTTFRKWDGQWWPERGRHATLDENPTTGELVFTSQDGTRYFYDAPRAPAIGESVSGVARDRISVSDGTASRVGVDPNALNIPGVAPGAPGVMLPNQVMGAGVPTRAKRIEDRNGNTMTFGYRPDELLSTITDAVGRTTTLSYSVIAGFDRITQVTGPGGLAVTYGYDARGYLISATRAGRVERYEYEAESDVVGGDYNLVRTIVSPDGVERLATVYTYGSEQSVGAGLETFLRHVRSADVVESVLMPSRPGEVPREPRIVFGYPATSAQNSRSVTNENGHTTTYMLNANANPVRIEEPLGRVTLMKWSGDEPDGRDNVLIEQTDSLTQTHTRTTRWAREYDSRGRVTKLTMTDTYGNSVVTVLDPRWSLPLSVTDRNGIATIFVYDERGNLLTFTDGDHHVHVNTYDTRGLLLTSKEPGHQAATTYTYDAYGLVDVVTRPEGSETDTDQDARGRTVRVVDPLGNVSSFTHDDLDRLTLVTVPIVTLAPARAEALASLSARRTVERSYDHLGNVLTETNLNGLTTTNTYTARGQLASTRRSVGSGTVRLRYDAVGALLGQTDWKNNETTFGYDALGRRTSTTNRLLDVATTEYDLAGRAIRVTDYAGHVTTATYDDLDRLLAREVLGENGSLVTLTYFDEADPSTNLKTTTVERDPLADATTTYTYDGRYHLVEREDALQQPHTWTFDASGDGVSEVDESGRTTRREYDEQHRLRHTHLDASEGTISTETRYDEAGNVTERVDPDGRVVEFVYDQWQRPYIRRDQHAKAHYVLFDALGNTVNVRDRLGHDRTTIRDALGRVALAIDGNGDSVSTHYDANGNVERVVQNALGRTVAIEYDAEDRTTVVTEGVGRPEVRSRAVLLRNGMGLPVDVRDYNGNVTHTEYDAEYRPRHVTDAHGEVAHLEYTRSGLVTAATDRRGFATSFEYDLLGRQTVVRNARGEETVRTYDAAGHLRTERDPRQFVTEYDYDGFDRLTGIRRAGQAVAGYQYDALGNVRFATDGRGTVTEHVYDDLNRITRTIHPGGLTSRLQYDDEGRVVRATNEESESVRLEHDAEGRVLRRALLGDGDAELAVTSFTYDAAGKVLTRTDPEAQSGGRHAGFTRSFVYDAHSRLTGVTEGSLSTTLEYDDNSNVRHVRLPPNAHVEYTYDELNRKTAMIQHRAAGNLTWSYSAYDEEGNLLSSTDPMGQTTTATYDELGRTASTTYPARAGRSPSRGWLAQVTYDYDANGNVESVIQERVGPGGVGSATETITRAYDAFDRLDVETDRGLSIDYAYDENGNRTLVSSPAGSTTFRYDPRNRLDRVTIGGEHTNYAYYDDGVMHSIVRPNGAATTITPEPYTNRVHRIDHVAGVAGFASVEYTYDRNGNPLTESQTIGEQTETTTFDYDALDRMVSFSRGTQGQVGSATGAYTFEGYDRKTETLTDPIGAVTERSYTYDDVGRLERVDVVQAAVTRAVSYGYDANGNTVSRTDSSSPTEPTTYVYDGVDHLADVVHIAGGVEQALGAFEYDAGGRRIRHHGSDRGAVETYFDGASVLEERTVGTGELLGHYRYGLGLLALDTPSEGRQWYHQDARQSTMALTNQTNATVDATYRLDPFGGIRSQTGTSANRRVFTGHEHDTNTGLVNMGARFYDPETARFITQDSYLGEGGTPPSLNRYLYAYSNPGRYVDPDGHAPCSMAGVPGWTCRGSGSSEAPIIAEDGDSGEITNNERIEQLVARHVDAVRQRWEETRDGMQEGAIRARSQYQNMQAVYASLDASLSSWTNANPSASRSQQSERHQRHWQDAMHVGANRWVLDKLAGIAESVVNASDAITYLLDSPPTFAQVEASAVSAMTQAMNAYQNEIDSARAAGFINDQHPDAMMGIAMNRGMQGFNRLREWWTDIQGEKAEAIGDATEFALDVGLEVGIAAVAAGVGELAALRHVTRLVDGGEDVISSGRRLHSTTPGRRAAQELEEHVERHGDFHGPWREHVESFDYGAYLRREIGPSPDGMYDPHAHHVLFKRGLGPAQQELVRRGQDILRRRGGIDPIYGLQNLAWAPNRVPGQHGSEVLQRLVRELELLDQASARPDAFEEVVRRFANEAALRQPRAQ